MKSDLKFLGEEDNSHRCKTCKFIKSKHYERVMWCNLEKSNKEQPVDIRRLNWCPFKKREMNLTESCDKWELSKTRKLQSEREYRNEQIDLHKKYKYIDRIVEDIRKKVQEDYDKEISVNGKEGIGMSSFANYLGLKPKEVGK